MTKTKDCSYIILVYLLSLLKRIVEVVFLSDLGTGLVSSRQRASQSWSDRAQSHGQLTLCTGDCL